MAWSIHVCFLLKIRNGGLANPRGPVLIRLLLVAITTITGLIIRSRIIEKEYIDRISKISFWCSVGTVVLLVLYCISIIPGKISVTQARRISRYRQVILKLKIYLYQVICL